FYTMNSWSMVDVLRGSEGEVVMDPAIKDFEGDSFVIQAQTGMELGGFGNRWLYYVGVVNGNIINPMGSVPGEDVFVFGAGKNTSSKDYYAGFAYKFGGLGFDGTGPGGDDPLSSRAEYWRDDSLTLSFFGYRGTGVVKVALWDDKSRNVTSPHTTYNSGDDFWRVGAGAMYKHGNLTLNAGYMKGKNDDPYGILSDAEVETDAWFVEGHYFVYPWLIPYLRYEGLYFSGLPSGILLDGEQDREILTLGCKAHLRANVSLQMEDTLYTRDDGYDYGLDNTIFLQLIAGF
ncbi:hypothetical protein ACFL0Q_06575, partial [Thermodesulfobacteriota bacterium]